MLVFKKVFLCLIYSCIMLSVVNCANNTEAEKENFGDKLMEQGRTFAHHTLKRFMILAPAIFFKLGIAFTLLILVTLVAANNGVIGFLILVVGLSSVLSRLEGSSSYVQPISYAPLPQLSHHHHPWISKRVDSIKTVRSEPTYNSNDDFRNTGVYFKDQYSDSRV